MRTYGEPVDVRVDARADLGMAGEGSPEQFLWRGRLYVVREVLAHWVELGTWWSGPARPAARAAATTAADAAAAAAGAADPAAGAPPARRSVALDVGAVEREVWRVEARAGRTSSVGVYDLVHDIPPAGRSRWRLARALD